MLSGLDNLVLVMWEDDTTIIPKVGKMSISSPLEEKVEQFWNKRNFCLQKESAHFGFYALEQDTQVHDLQTHLPEY